MPSRTRRRWFRFAPALLLPFAGCVGSYGDVDLLEARLRDQQDLVARYQKLADSTQQELAIARKESDLLRTQLAQAGTSPLLPEHADVLLRAEKLAFHPMMTGARNIDAAPGDDVLNVVLAPQSQSGETIRLIGDLEIEALDLSRPEGEQRIGTWTYTAEQARELWHAGFLASGFQMDLAWDTRPQSSDVLLHARLKTADGRQLDATQQVHVELPVVQTAMTGAPPQITPRQVATARPVPPPATEFTAKPPEVLPDAAVGTMLAPSPLDGELASPARTAGDPAPLAAAPVAIGTSAPAPFPPPVDVSARDAAAVAVSVPASGPTDAETPFDILPQDVPRPVDVPPLTTGAMPRANPVDRSVSPSPAEFPMAVPGSANGGTPFDPVPTVEAQDGLPTIAPSAAPTPFDQSPSAAVSEAPTLPNDPAPGAGIQIQPLPVPQRYRRAGGAGTAPVPVDSGSTTPFDALQPAAPVPAPSAPAPFPGELTPATGAVPAAAATSRITPTSVNWSDESIPYLR